jgi:hypothetical protein
MKEEDMAINFFLKKREEASFLCQWYMGEWVVMVGRDTGLLSGKIWLVVDFFVEVVNRLW